jgi:voltage-gated potassium channel
MLRTVPPKQYASLPGLRGRLNELIFGVDSPRGRAFDVALIGVITLSVIAVLLESVAAIRAEYGRLLMAAEWIFTILFTIEYLLRLYCARSPVGYAVSFFGVVDFLGTIPTYLSVLLPGAQFLLVIRLLRILRVFRVLRLAQFLTEADVLVRALRASRHKILVFLFSVMTLVVILGSLMYLIEGSKNGFTSIPRSIYWAIVTLTTVGYGDISPQTSLGQALAAVVMILGYGIIAVPTGIVTAELTRRSDRHHVAMECSGCGVGDHDLDAQFCRKCGERL